MSELAQIEGLLDQKSYLLSRMEIQLNKLKAINQRHEEEKLQMYKKMEAANRKLEDNKNYKEPNRFLKFVSKILKKQ